MPYERRESLPDVEAFLALRKAAGLTPYSREAAERGLANTVFGVSVYDTDSAELVGMGRIVGDGGCIYHICDMAVHPDHQRQGLGSHIMDRLVQYLEEEAPEGAYVNLMADVDGFYEAWGFEQTAPASKGMAMWT